ncbi:hypothetical protein ACLK19_28285 [Escherichia coli]
MQSYAHFTSPIRRLS